MFRAICWAAPGSFLDRVGTGGEDIKMDGNALGFRNLHIAQSLFVALRPTRTAVAELLAVAGFLADDHNRGGVGLVLQPPGDGGLGADHRRIDVGIAFAAQFGVVFVDIFEDVLQAETLDGADDSYPFHGGEVFFRPLFEKTDRLVQFADLRLEALFTVVVEGHFQLVASLLETVEIAPVRIVLDLQQVVDPFFYLQKLLLQFFHSIL